MSAESNQDGSPIRGLPFRVLVVDDDPNLGESLRDVLTDKGFDVVVVTQGEMALGALSREHFDLCLLDIRMPGLDGADTAQLIHTLKPDLPVLMMTGYDLDERARRALEEGAVAILSKPLDIEHAVDLIERTVKRPSVLIVAPDQAEADTVRRALESSHCLTAVAPGLSGARQALSKASYDVIILDSQLVREQGPDALVEIGRLQPNAYLVFVRAGQRLPGAGDREVGETQRTLEAQIRHAAFAVVDKPASAGQVLRVIQRIKELLKEKRRDR